MRYMRLIILFLVWSLSTFVWADAPKFQSPTNDPNTKGCDGTIMSEFNQDIQK